MKYVLKLDNYKLKGRQAKMTLLCLQPFLGLGLSRRVLGSIPWHRVSLQCFFSADARGDHQVNCNKSPLYFTSNWSEGESSEVTKSFRMMYNFISTSEEECLFNEVEPHLKRQVYEKDHWDEAIIGFRETERKQWNPKNSEVISRLRTEAFEPGQRLLPHVHVLDLSKDGYIKAHIDSARFCGDTVAVLSLLSDAVLRLVIEADKSKYVDCLVPRRSLYIIKGFSRYQCTHEILKNDESIVNGQHVLKDRRISIVCRNDSIQDTK